MQKVLTLFILLMLTSVCSVEAQTYPKAPGVIRLLTYNTHYGKGGGSPGVMNDSNIVNLGRVIRALDADIISLQELDSASQGRATAICCATSPKARVSTMPTSMAMPNPSTKTAA